MNNTLYPITLNDRRVNLLYQIIHLVKRSNQVLRNGAGKVEG